MTFTKGVPAPNRKVPADDIIIREVNAGLTNAEIGRKYNCSAQTVCSQIFRLGIRRKVLDHRALPVIPQRDPREHVVVLKSATGKRVSLARVAGYYEDTDA